MIKQFRILCCVSLMISPFCFADTAANNAPTVPVTTPSLTQMQTTQTPPTQMPGEVPKPDLLPKPDAIKMPMPVVTVPAPPVLNVKAYVLMDAATGKILASYNADQRLEPASLTKMMTSYVVSMALRDGKIHLTDQVPISEKAWRTGGSKMFVKVGTTVPVDQLMQGIIVDSGNDACVAMAEYVAGSEDSFAGLMDQTAAALGMKNTHYVDSTGLPNPDHYSTAHDMAILARALIYSFPEHYQWYSQKWFTYNNIRQPNRNRLLWRDPTADGVKTGHTDSAGYCLVSSAKRNGQRLIAVVMGAPTDAARADDSQRLLDYGFRFFETHALYQANASLATVRVWQGRDHTTAVGVAEPFIVSVIPGQYPQVKIAMKLDGPFKAPIIKGQALGQITATLGNKVIEQAPLVALQDNPVGSWWQRLIDKILHLFK